MPNRVAMVRKTGMVIYKHAFKGLRLKFAGTFICANETGNTILRNMEPPRHDEWDVNLPEKGASKKYQNEYRQWLRAILLDLTPKIESTMLEVDELADYLPDAPTSETGGGKSNLTGEDANAFTDASSAVSEPIVEIVAVPVKKREVPDATAPPTGHTDGDGEGDGNGTTGNEREGQPIDKPESGGAGEGQNSEPTPPPQPTSGNGGVPPPVPKKKQQASITSKSFADAQTNEYIICLKSTTATTLDVGISLVGEDNFTDIITLVNARDRDTGEPLTVSGNRVKEVKFTPSVLRRIAVSFGDSVHYAVNIETYEI